MSRVILFGTGRGADVAYRFLKKDSPHEIAGFALDSQYIKSDTLRGLPVCAFEDVERQFPPEDFRMMILLGYQNMNGLRADKFAAAKAKGYTLESYVCSNIFQAEPIRTGENCFILDNQSISLDTEFGDNVVMWSSNHIGDLTKIGDHAWISSHVTLAANTIIAERAFLGIGATVTNGVRIGARAFVGAHALAAADVPDDGVFLHPGQSPEMTSQQFMRIMTAKGKL